MILARPVKPRATRSADIVASVPDETKRIFSSDGIMNREQLGELDLARGRRAEGGARRRRRATMAATTSGSAWPRISGPHEPTKST